jgi:heat shock protein HslJ
MKNLFLIVAASLAITTPSVSHAEEKPPLLKPILPLLGVDKQLQGRWRVVAFWDEETLSVQPVYEDLHNFALEFKGVDLRVTGECNARWSKVTAKAGRFNIVAGWMSTRRLCPNSEMKEGRRFAKALPSIGYYFIAKEKLHLFNSEGDLRVVLFPY